MMSANRFKQRYKSFVLLHRGVGQSLMMSMRCNCAVVFRLFVV